MLAECRISEAAFLRAIAAEAPLRPPPWAEISCWRASRLRRRSSKYGSETMCRAMAVSHSSRSAVVLASRTNFSCRDSVMADLVSFAAFIASPLDDVISNCVWDPATGLTVTFSSGTMPLGTAFAARSDCFAK
eukprot:Amastigsp_a847848_37.p3 type:complete len:133 gc:universal Amastigsp_a847848_37:1529-1131(-)